MKYKKHLLIITPILVGMVISASVMFNQPAKQPIKLETAAAKVNTTPPPPTPVTTPVATVVPTTPVKVTVTPKPAVVPVTPDPTPVVPAPPKNGTEWLINYKNTHTADETTCMVTLIILRINSAAFGTSTPDELQAQEDYALAHYPSICFAEASAEHPNY